MNFFLIAIFGVIFIAEAAKNLKTKVRTSPDCQCDCTCKTPICSTTSPSMKPTGTISVQPTKSTFFTQQPSAISWSHFPTQKPSQESGYNPSSRPTSAPSASPTSSYTIRVFTPTSGPTGLGHTRAPTEGRSGAPTDEPAPTDDGFSFNFEPSPVPTERPTQAPSADDDFSFSFTEKPTVDAPLNSLSPNTVDVSREPSFKPSFRSTTAGPSIASGDAVALCAISAKTNIMSFSEGDQWSCSEDLPTRARLCDWDGVTCSSSGRVTALYPSQGLNGTLVGVNLALMTELQSIFLINGALVGSLPASIGKLKKLTELVVANNEINGPIPSSYSSISTLTSLQIFDTKISGSIPPSLSELSQLRTLNLQSNFLSGDVPISLCDIGLTSVNLSGNSGLICYPQCLTAVANHDFGTTPMCA